MAEEKSGQHPQSHEQQHGTGAKPATKSADDDLMAIRRATGGIAEVIEPVQRTRLERTDR